MMMIFAEAYFDLRKLPLPLMHGSKGKNSINIHQKMISNISLIDLLC